MRIVFLLSLLFVFTSCATTRTVPFTYEEVSNALKERFAENYDEFKQTKPEVGEKTNQLTIKFDSPVDFFYSVRVTLGAKKIDDANTVLSAWIIEEHRTFWGSSGRNKPLEKTLLDIVGKRLETGTWNRMPWRPVKKTEK